MGFVKFVNFHGNPFSSCYTRSDGQRDMVTLIWPLLQLCVEAVPQSGMFMLTVYVLRVLFVETHCSDERRTGILFVKLMKYK
jgi:hypothetical protein